MNKKTTNKKTTNKKTSKKRGKKRAPKYTRLTIENIGDIISDATANLIHDKNLATEIDETFEVEESEESPGTYFVEYEAKTWRDAVAFKAAIIGQAFAFGYYADASAEWEHELVGMDKKRRHVSVFVAAADYMRDNGRGR